MHADLDFQPLLQLYSCSAICTYMYIMYFLCLVFLCSFCIFQSSVYLCNISFTLFYHVLPMPPKAAAVCLLSIFLETCMIWIDYIFFLSFWNSRPCYHALDILLPFSYHLIICSIHCSMSQSYYANSLKNGTNLVDVQF